MTYLVQHQSDQLWGTVKWKPNTRYKVTMEFVLFTKLIVRSVNTFIPLGEEIINSSLVETGKLLMDPQPHLLLHFIWMNLMSMNVFLQVAKNVEVTRGKIWAVQRLKCFSAKSLKLILNQIGSMGKGVIMQKDDSAKQHSRALIIWHVAAPSATINEPHLSALLCLPPFPMLDEHTLHYAHLQSNKETTVWTCAFSLYMSPTLQMTVSIRNNSVASFCEECVLWRVFGFHFTAP